MAVLKNSAILLKNFSCGVVLQYFYGQNKYKISSVRRKELKSIKTINVCFKMHFFGSNRLKTHIELWGCTNRYSSQHYLGIYNDFVRDSRWRQEGRGGFWLRDFRISHYGLVRKRKKTAKIFDQVPLLIKFFSSPIFFLINRGKCWRGCILGKKGFNGMRIIFFT